MRAETPASPGSLRNGVRGGAGLGLPTPKEAPHDACRQEAVAYMLYAGRRISWDIVIAGPLLLPGVLFLLGWRYRKELCGGS